MDIVKFLLCDAHTHLQDFDSEDIPKILRESESVGIKYIVCNQTVIGKLPEVLLNSPMIIPCIGVHPWFISQNDDFELMEASLKEDPRLQVGEIGLDFGHSKETKKEQMDKFIKQVELAIKYGRTMSVHCVRAQGEMLKILKKLNIQTTPIVMHSYNGSKEFTASYNKLSPEFYYSLSLSILNRPDIIQEIPIDKLLLETDSPYQLYGEFQNPRIFKEDKKASEPKYLGCLVEFVSEQLKIEKQVLMNQLMANFLRAFRHVK